jgi:hypothetical protein
MSGKRVKLLIALVCSLLGASAFMHYAQGPASKIQAALAIPRLGMTTRLLHCKCHWPIRPTRPFMFLLSTTTPSP